MKSPAPHMNVKMKDAVKGITGVVTFTNRELTTSRAFEIDKILENAVNIPHAEYRALIRELDKLCPSREMIKCNLVVLTGRSALASVLAGEGTYTGIINYGCLGTSATAVADSDTQLGAEVKRKQVATRTRTNAQFTLDFYYSKGDISGTFQEFGMVIDGNTSANTGQLFNHLLTGGWTKSSSISLTASVQVNINNS